MECVEIDGKYIVLIIGIIVVFIYCMIEVDYNDKMKRIADNYQTTENFVVYTYPKGRSCDECKTMNRKRCGECINCGYCYSTDGYGECVAGDHTGPYTRRDCVDYEYAKPVTVDPMTVDDTSNWYYPSWGDGWSQFYNKIGYGWFDYDHNDRDHHYSNYDNRHNQRNKKRRENDHVYIDPNESGSRGNNNLEKRKQRNGRIDK